MTNVICPKCRAKIDVNDIYCKICGFHISEYLVATFPGFATNESKTKQCNAVYDDDYISADCDSDDEDSYRDRDDRDPYYEYSPEFYDEFSCGLDQGLSREFDTWYQGDMRLDELYGSDEILEIFGRQVWESL